jgi:hypothetical protein
MSESHVPPDTSPEQGGASRRLFLAGTGAGLAVTAVGVASATQASAAPAEPGASVAEAQVAAATVKPGAPIVVYVADSARDRVSIQRGGTEVVVRDAALVKALRVHLNRRHAAPVKES